MANYDFLFIYNDADESWLRTEGCCVPPVLPGNRYPTMQEVVAAVEAEGLQATAMGEDVLVLPPRDAASVFDGMMHGVRYIDVCDGKLVEASGRGPQSYLVRIHSYNWAELNVNKTASITMRGNFALELFLVRRLAECCGQLLLYPDTGDPPVVVEADDDIGRKASAWLEAVNSEAAWAEFYQRIKSPE